ncbi:MAG: PIN domain-containing protein [Cocleimonas sp.]
MNIYLDANILVDIYDNTRVSHQASLEAVSNLAADYNVELFTSCDIITTIYYVLSKVDKSQALQTIIDISDLCDVVEFSNKEIKKSCQLMLDESTKYLDLEDTIQYVLAQKAQCDLILSNDTKFVSTQIRLMSSQQFISQG